MRPKKRILLIDNDEVRRSCTAFQLRIWGYALATPDSQADLIVAFTPVDEEKVRKTAELLVCPSLLIRDVRLIGPGQCTTTLLEPEPWFLLDHIKTLCARKRGPLPKAVKAARESFRAHTHIDVRNSFQVAGCQEEANG